MVTLPPPPFPIPPAKPEPTRASTEAVVTGPIGRDENRMVLIADTGPRVMRKSEARD